MRIHYLLIINYLQFLFCSIAKTMRIFISSDWLVHWLIGWWRYLRTKQSRKRFLLHFYYMLHFWFEVLWVYRLLLALLLRAFAYLFVLFILMSINRIIIFKANYFSTRFEIHQCVELWLFRNNWEPSKLWRLGYRLQVRQSGWCSCIFAKGQPIASIGNF